MKELPMIITYLLKMYKKYILATSDFAKGMQTDINHYVTNDRIINTSFSQNLDPINKKILRRENPLRLAFEDISKCDAENPIVRSLLKELDVGKKDIASELMNKTPRPPGVDFAIRRRLDKLQDRPEPKDDNNNFNFSPPPSPPRQPPPSFSQRPSSGIPPPLPFTLPPSGRFLEPFQQTTAQPRPLPPLQP